MNIQRVSTISILVVLIFALAGISLFADSSNPTIQVTKIKGKVLVMDANKNVKEVVNGSTLQANSIIKTAEDSMVQIKINDKSIVIPPNSTIPLQRFVSKQNPELYSRVLTSSRMNSSDSTGKIATTAGVRGSDTTASLTNTNYDVMLDEEDLDSKVFDAISKTQNFLATNQLDLAFVALEPYENYHGSYSTVVANLLGNLLYQRNEYDRAYPLLRARMDQPGLGKVEASMLRYKIITCLVNMDNLITAFNEINLWFNQNEKSQPELLPNILHYQSILAEYLEITDISQNAYNRLLKEFPDHPLTKELKEYYSSKQK